MIPEPLLTETYASTWENVPSDMCAQRWPNSACASAQSDQRVRCPLEETLHPWLSELRPVKILIRLRSCAVWSESSLGAHVRRYSLTFRRKYHWLNLIAFNSKLGLSDICLIIVFSVEFIKKKKKMRFLTVTNVMHAPIINVLTLVLLNKWRCHTHV